MACCEVISKGIITSIGTFWKRHENEDFQVNLEDESVRCHSFILASCSEFFGSLLRSNMKEKQDMKVDLQNIPSDIFLLILETLYTGCELLTKDNVLEVWSAVHQLQIHFLIQHCEEFVLGNISLETLETYKKQAEFLQSEKVSEGVFKYMLEHFMTFRKTETFLRLDYGEISKLIESDSLVVTSEDLVLQSVFEWINFGEVCISTVENDNASKLTSSTEVITHSSKMDYSGQQIDTLNVSVRNELKETREESKSNDASNNSLTQSTAGSSVNQNDGALSIPTKQRDAYLLPLLKATRYFLLSDTCIANLNRNKLIRNSTQSIQFLFESLTSKICINPSGYLPPAAIHRQCSQSENMGIVNRSNNMILAHSFVLNKWYYFPDSTKLNICKLLAFNNVLFACVNHDSSSEMFLLHSVQWVSVLKLEEHIRFCLSHDTFIIFITVQNSLVYRYKPFSPITKIDIDIGAIDFAISFYQNILLFTTSDLKTKVRCWDTDSNTLSHLAELDFSAKSMTSFSDERCTYILDELGQLYQVTQLETVQFTFIDKLWSFKALELRGAVLIRGELYVCGKFPAKRDHKDSVQGIFTSCCFLKSRYLEYTSNFITFAILKTDLTEI
ncbi:kelch protein 8 [Biomphalaria glabrata]|nr:kelch protein 8 [Biomphalaria glabrata]